MMLRMVLQRNGNCQFQGALLPKTESCEGTLKADAYGFYDDWDWTPELIAKMRAATMPRSTNAPKFLPETQKVIPCQGVETDEEFYENWKPQTWWHDISK